MKPLIADSTDTLALERLGRASVQIIHDLKNQINGLKLYATFLKKRLEKAGSPSDEQETVSKLISGLDRAAADMTALVRLGRPLELRLQKSVDLPDLVRKSLVGEPACVIESENEEPIFCEADASLLAEAIKTITSGAVSRNPGTENKIRICLSIDRNVTPNTVTIEWDGISAVEQANPFDSFAGSEGLRMSLAARLIQAHKGECYRQDNRLIARLPAHQELM